MMQKNVKNVPIADYKQKARVKYRKLVATRKLRRGLPLKEQFALWKKDHATDKKWKKKINSVESKPERKAQKKGYKLYKKLLRRKYVIIIWSVILLTIITLFSSWYYGATRPLTAEQKTAREHSLPVANDVMSEGTVLLRNENNVLPLQSKKVSVFGASAASPVYGGGGAGGIASKDVETLYAAFDKTGIEYNKPLYNVYSNYAFDKKVSTDDYKTPTGTSLLDTLLPNIAGFLAGATAEMPVDKLPSEVLDNAKSYSNTAVYVISRAGMETKDFKADQLKLTDDERSTLKLVNENFAHVVVLLNTTNAFEVSFVKDFNHVEGVMWIGAPGEAGTEAIANTLLGNINPSGRLTDTYAYDINSNPAVANTGDFQYKKDGVPAKRYFVNELENIYVGYRYYETFLDEAQYNSTVQYPFGYGLSYTTFDWKLAASKADENNIKADVTVKNTGSVAGKDVVQVYFEAPFTQGGIEKSAKVLAGYAKTGLLQPGESQTVSVEFKTNSMASYDDTNAKTWVLDAGNYKIDVAHNVHTTAASFSYKQVAQKIINTDSVTGANVTNRFDDADGGLSYFSRSNPVATFPAKPEGDDFNLPAIVPASDYKHKASTAANPTTDAQNNIKLVDLKGLAYDDPKWQQFVQQFTTNELVKMAGDGGYWTNGIDRLGIPKTSMYDGPASIRSFLQAWATVAYPIPINLSATWNDSLAEEVGRSMGAEARSFNVDAVYAPSVNLHRSPLGGRNFEYFSEDPLLAGKFGAAWTRGLQENKTVAVMKHFAANEQETNRANFGLYTWMTEQSMRELYLKPFELTVKEGNAHGAMSAFNRIGAVWAGGSKPLLTDVLRTEWGFKGFVVTDAGLAGQGEHFDALQAVEAGNDLMLASLISMPGDNTFEAELKTYLKQDRAGTIIALQNAAHNITYYVLQTSKVK